MTVKKSNFAAIIAGFLVLAAPPFLAGQALAAASPVAASSLRQILIGESDEAAAGLKPVAGGGFVVIPPAFSGINVQELTTALSSAEYRTIDDGLLQIIANATESFFRGHGFPKATATVPRQEITGGAVRVTVTLGAPVAAPPAPIAYPLRQILIGESVEAAEKLSLVPGGGFVVLPSTLSFINTKELTKALAAGENRPIDDRLLVAIRQVVESFFRRNDFPIATAIIPEQRFTDGALRVSVLLGKFREIRFQGNRWFSDSLLRDKLHVEKGEVVRVSDLERAVNWTNDSPFRRVRVHIDPIPNSDEANLIVGVQERLPLRLTASADDGGNEAIGKHRFIAGVSYGNMWGRDHAASYQFVTTDKSQIYQAHGLNYRVPLAWRHTLQVTASYAHAVPEFYDGLFVQDGENASADLRYSIPLKSGDNPVEAFASLGFKQSNNNLEFGGSQVQSSKTDSFTLSAGISTVRRDSKGAWILGATVTGSPGGLNSRNRDEIFDAARLGAKASYVIGSLSVQRLLILTKGWEFSSRGALQLSSEKLLATEQFSGGGASTMRGFDENTVLGDEGFALSNEILSPVHRKALPFLGKTRAPLESRLLLFMDAAKVSLKHAYSFDRPMRALASAGVGLRMSLPNNLSFTADYGWQLSRLAPGQDRDSRGHLKLVLAY